MPGYLPQNSGNKSGLRVGPGVTRRLKQAGINVSPAACRHHRPGIYVAARGLFISVYVDLRAVEAVRQAAQEVARVVTSWGLAPEVSESTHDNGETTATVRFNHPAPKPPESRRPASSGRAGSQDGTAAPEGMEWMRVQATTVQGTLAAAGFWSSEGVTVEQSSATAATVQAPAALLEGITAALRRKKYTVGPGDAPLTVRKLKKTKRS